MQSRIGRRGGLHLDEQLVIIESETGSGKTEAALWRFARMYEDEIGGWPVLSRYPLAQPQSSCTVG